MRICILTSQHPPKDDRLFYKEALSLAGKYGHIDIVAPGGLQPVGDSDPRFSFHLLQPRAGLVGRFARLLEAQRIVRRIAPDICHFHDFDIALFVSLFGFRTSARLVYDVHELYPESLATRLPVKVLRPITRRALCAIENRSARRCALLVTAVEPLTERFKKAGAQAITVYNYPRLELLALPEGHELKKALRYPGRRVVLYQGQISKARGLFQMVRAMPLIKQRLENALLVLVGPVANEERKKAECLITELGVKEDVVFAGSVGHLEVFDFIREAELGLAPFLPVGQYGVAVPIKLFEYWGCGIPVVGSDLPTTRYYIEQSGGGLVCNALSYEALANAIIQMLCDHSARERMGALGLRAVRERWNWGKMEERLLGAYADLQTGLTKGGSHAVE